MWNDEKTVRVQRSLTEMLIDDLEYEGRRAELKAEKAVEDAVDDALYLIPDFLSTVFTGSPLRRGRR